MPAALRPFWPSSARGAEIGALAMLALAVIDTAAALPVGTGRMADAAALFAQVALVLLLAGGALGSVEGALVYCIHAGCARLPSPIARRVLYAACLSVPFSALWLELLFDRWAALGTPARASMVAGLVLMQPLMYVLARALTALGARLVDDATPRATRVALTGAALLLAIGCYMADARILPRLYEPMHRGFALGAFLAMEVAALGLLDLVRARPLYRGVAWAVVAALVGVAGARALGRLGDDPALTFAALERTHIEAKLLKAGRAAFDRDSDGHASVLGGGDCDDADSRRHPAALDLPENGIDEDCSGADLRLEDLAPPAAARPPVASGASHHVLLITVDALRADHLGVYGYERPTSPHIDALARSAWLFERAYAQSNNTAASVPSLVTGRYPSSSPWSYEHPKQHGPGWAYVTDDGNVTLAELLRGAGYRTAAYVETGPIFQLGLDQGYGEARKLPKPGARLAEFVTARKAEPWHAWLHLDHPHAPYDVHERYRFGDTDLDRYDGEVAAADAEVGVLVEALKRSGNWDDTLVVLTADHGEEFREHGGTQHATTLYEELIHVPLIVKLPGASPRKIARPVELVDVLPTILEAVGIERPAWLDGQSLLDVARPGDVTAYTEKYNGRVLMSALIRDNWKLIAHRDHQSFELYDLRADPGERDNLVGEQRGRLKRLRMELDTLAARRELVLLATARRHPESRFQLSRSLELMQRPELVEEALRILEATPDPRFAPDVAARAANRALPFEVRAKMIALLEKLGGVEAFRGLVPLTGQSDAALAVLAERSVQRLAPGTEHPFAWPDRALTAPEVEHVDFGTRHGHWRVIEGISGRAQVNVRTLAWSDGDRSRVALWVDPKTLPARGAYVLDAVGRVHPDAPGGEVSVGVTLNAEPLGDLLIGDDFEPRRLAVPSAALRAGLNELELVYSDTVRSGDRSRSVQWDYLVLLPERPSAIDLLPGSPPSAVEFAEGWGNLELWRGVLHRLSRGKSSVLRFDLEPGATGYFFRYEAAGRESPVLVNVTVNGRTIGSASLDETWTTGELPVPSGLLVKGPNTIRFDYGWNGDSSTADAGRAVRWHAINVAPAVDGPLR